MVGVEIRCSCRWLNRVRVVASLILVSSAVHADHAYVTVALRERMGAV